MSNPSKATRDVVFLRSGGHCQRCERQIYQESFHVAHVRAAANGGIDDPTNYQAWCIACNLRNGSQDAGPRFLPNEWQSDALDRITHRIADSGIATVMAAPGAGKTLFAAFLFESLRALGIVDRMVVFVPSLALVEQWEGALKIGRHITLMKNRPLERESQHGTIVTYASMQSSDAVNAHRLKASSRKTLVVLDEVHHLCERPNGEQTAWARNLTDFVGSVGALKVAGVLNLSGTLWRSARSERVAMVRYIATDDDRLQSETDYSVFTEDLIHRGRLRPVDIYRLDSKVRLTDFKVDRQFEGNLSELEQEQSRATIRLLPSNPDARGALVEAVLDRLEDAHRSLGGHHMKAMIVATRQDEARAYCDEVNRQMVARGLRPFGVVAVSEEPDAPSVLRDFRRQQRPGVLCTVNMAGEGYDCPEIAVVGYSTNRMTPLFVRQVVARAQRVTDKEREKGERIPAVIVCPDAQELVDLVASCVKSYTVDVLLSENSGSDSSGAGDGGTGQRDVFSIPGVRYGLEEASIGEKFRVPYADGSHEDMEAELIKLVAEEMERAGLMRSNAARAYAAATRANQRMTEERPFDAPLSGLATLEPVAPKVVVIPLGEDEIKNVQFACNQAARWWAINGDKSISAADFNAR